MKPLSDALGCTPAQFTGPVEVGDTVMIGANAGPVYVVVHVADGMAWIRPLSHGSEGLVPVERLRSAG